jgi:hypothetical protein
MHVPLGDSNGTVPCDAGQHENVATCCFTKASQSRVAQRIGTEGFHARISQRLLVLFLCAVAVEVSTFAGAGENPSIAWAPSRFVPGKQEFAYTWGHRENPP